MCAYKRDFIYQVSTLSSNVLGTLKLVCFNSILALHAILCDKVNLNS